MEASIRQQIAAIEADMATAFPVYTENWQALEIFLELSSQWLLAPMGGFLALDGRTLLAYLELTGEPMARRRELYTEVQQIASGAIDAWRKQAEKKQPSPTDDLSDEHH